MMFVLLPDLGEEKTNSYIAEVKELITSGEGRVLNEDIWGIRKLAYTIKKQEQGFYMVLNFEISPDKIQEIKNTLNIHPKVIRYLITSTPKNYVFKTLKEYEEQWEKEEKDEEMKLKKDEEKKEEQKLKVAKPKHAEEVPAPKVKAKIAKAEEKEVEKKEEVKEEHAEKPKAEGPKNTEGVLANTVSELCERTPKKKKDEDKESRTRLEEFDEKLKSIINNPDISL